MGELRYKALFDELTRCPVLISLTWFFSPDGLLAGVFLQAGWDFLHGAPEGGRGGTRPADRHAHRRQQRVDKGNADRGRHAVLNTRQGLCSNGNGHISL